MFKLLACQFMNSTGRNERVFEERKKLFTLVYFMGIYLFEKENEGNYLWDFDERMLENATRSRQTNIAVLLFSQRWWSWICSESNEFLPKGNKLLVIKLFSLRRTRNGTNLSECSLKWCIFLTAFYNIILRPPVSKGFLQASFSFQDRPELTPVAIMAGKLLARRLFDNATELMEYDKVSLARLIIVWPLIFGYKWQIDMRNCDGP